MSTPVAEEKHSVERMKAGLNFAGKLAGEAGHIIRQVIEVFQEGVDSANPMISILSLVSLIDILHGGAYKKPAYTLPYYDTRTDWGVGFQFPLTTFAVVTLPNGQKLNLPPGATEGQAEAVVNSAELHVLPKIMSDQVWFLIKDWISPLFAEKVFGTVATSLLGSGGLKTLVKGSRIKGDGSGTLRSAPTAIRPSEE